MELATFERINRSERSARAYLLDRGGRPAAPCPRCAARKPYLLADGRMRCARCRYTFHLRTGRWLNQGAFSFQGWMRVVKLFELDVAAGTAAAQLGVTYKTAHRAFTTVRRAIAARSPDAALLAAGPGAIFGHRQQGAVTVLRALTPVEVEGLATAGLCSLGAGPLALTGPWRQWRGLISHRPVLARLTTVTGGPRNASGFRHYVTERVRRYRGLSALHLPLYLLEMELRYNLRGGDLFAAVAACLRMPVPVRTEGARRRNPL